MTGTICEKLTAIAQNEKKVYSAGEQKGYFAGYKTGYSDGHEKGFSEGESAEYSEGYERGKKEEYDAFWDAYQNYGNRNRYDYAFYQWGAETAHPKYKIIPTNANSLSQTFGESKLKKIEAAYFDFSKKNAGTYNQASNYWTFANCRKLEEIEDIGMCDTFQYASTFTNCSELHTVAVLRVGENTTFDKAFNACKKLKSIKIEGTIGQNGLDFSACKELSADSIRSIITHLSDTAQGKTLTLSRKAVENAITSGGLGGDTAFMTSDGQFGKYLYSNPIPLTAGQRIKVTFDAEDDHSIATDDVYTDWWFGLAGARVDAPYELSGWTYTAAKDEQVTLVWFFHSDLALSNIPIKIRVALVDGDGNEITGENLHSFAADTVTDSDYGTTLTIVEESWETLQASKPNWTITLV